MALVGDAGHGVTPNLGQGCNAALETVAVLDKVSSDTSLQHSRALVQRSRRLSSWPDERSVYNQSRCRGTGQRQQRLSPMSAQVLEVNRDKDLAFALAEYNRVRKPEMDALRYLDTISGRIWGGARSGSTIRTPKRISPRPTTMRR